MKVKTMIFLFQILAISTYTPPSETAQCGQENVAVRGKATQSAVYSTSTWSGRCHASNANDGNRDSDATHGSCAITTNTPNPWWRVDLLRAYVITSVTITNRGDCCPERISGAQIYVGTSSSNNGMDNPQCAVIESMTLGETRTFKCPQPVVGRYVTVYLPKGEYLQLCEVEVNALL